MDILTAEERTGASVLPREARKCVAYHIKQIKIQIRERVVNGGEKQIYIVRRRERIWYTSKSFWMREWEIGKQRKWP